MGKQASHFDLQLLSAKSSEREHGVHESPGVLCRKVGKVADDRALHGLIAPRRSIASVAEALAIDDVLHLILDWTLNETKGSDQQ